MRLQKCQRLPKLMRQTILRGQLASLRRYNHSVCCDAAKWLVKIFFRLHASSFMMIIAYPFNDMYEPSHPPALEPPCVVMTSSGVFPLGECHLASVPAVFVLRLGVWQIRAGLYG